jgi:hypothetical protein
MLSEKLAELFVKASTRVRHTRYDLISMLIYDQDNKLNDTYNLEKNIERTDPSGDGQLSMTTITLIFNIVDQDNTPGSLETWS